MIPGFRVMKGEPVVLAHLRYPIYVSPKLNGVRGHVQQKGVLSTSNTPLPNIHLQAAFGTALHRDGEFIVGDPQDTQNSLGRTQSIVMSDEKPVDGLKFYVFDHVENTGWEFERRTKLLKPSKNIIVVKHELVHGEEELLAKEHEYLQLGYEGLMTRDPKAPYKFGKSTAKQAWMGKLKRFIDDEAEIIGFEEEMHNGNEATVSETGRTKRSSAKSGKTGKGRLGALVLRHRNGSVFGCGAGFDHATRQTIWDNRSEHVGQLAKFKYFEAGSGDVPVLPVFLCIRDRRDT